MSKVIQFIPSSFDIAKPVLDSVDAGDYPMAAIVYVDDNEQACFVPLTQASGMEWRGFLGDVISLLRKEDWGENGEY